MWELQGSHLLVGDEAAHVLEVPVRELRRPTEQRVNKPSASASGRSDTTASVSDRGMKERL